MTELLIAVAIIGLLSAMSVNTFSDRLPWLRLRTGLTEFTGDLREARTEALLCNCNSALLFTRVYGEWGYAVYRDGNGNGVRNAEISSGVDPMIRPWKRVSGGVRIAMPGTVVRDPVENRNLNLSASPIRWNSTHLCSFSPGFDATPGSAIVITGDQIGAVVVNDQAAIRMMYYDSRGGWSRQLF